MWAHIFVMKSFMYVTLHYVGKNNETSIFCLCYLIVIGFKSINLM